MGSHRPWLSVSTPPAVDQIPSMLSPEEKQYLIWLTEENYQGWGGIVELGVWLGSSSASLAEGLRQRGSTTRIHSFDLFAWEPYMSRMRTMDLKAGDDFLPLYRRETAAYASAIEPHKVDLLHYGAWEGGPIEILFVDSAKDWHLTNAILKSFGPALAPGRSRIVLQDFRYPYAHCLPLIFDSRPDVWKQVEDTADATMVTFMPLKPLYGPSGIDTEYTEESFPMPSADHLLRSRIAREEPANQERLLRTLYRKHLIDGPVEETLALQQQVYAQDIDEVELASVEDVDAILYQRAAKAYTAGDYANAQSIIQRTFSILPKRSIYCLSLLGFSRLRMGDRAGADQAFNQLSAAHPDFFPAKLYRAETAFLDGRHSQAETAAWEVLGSGDLPDETSIQWCLNLLTQAWTAQGPDASRLARLQELAASFTQSPSFLACLAREEWRARQPV